MSDKNIICSLNDRFRKGDRSIPGERVVTQGIAELVSKDLFELQELMTAVAEFSEFSEANDPHGEHDFGAFDFNGAKCFWKLDVYDNALEWGAEHPGDTRLSKRVLTVMLASEY